MASIERDPVEQLAEQWRERWRRGEQFSADEYVERFPALADDIRELFDAIGLMEQLKPVARDLTGALTIAPSSGLLPAQGERLERLGDFRILREIGRGGMGVVYEAEQESLGRRVALKVLPAGMAQRASFLERFRREARAVARLHHTNIVPVHGVGEENGTCYYAMQFIQGQALDVVLDEIKRLRGVEPPASTVPTAGTVAQSVAHSLLMDRFRGGDLTAASGSTPVLPPAAPPRATRTDLSDQAGAGYYRRVALLGAQAAEGLAHAHSQGVLHRDIKPSNLLLDTHGTLWITDFGLAKADDSADLTEAGDIVGTIRYMAPERFEGKSDARSDVYAVGVTMYELLALRPPFDGTDRASLIGQITSETPPSLGTLAPGLRRDLETIVHKAMAREPAARYASAADLADDLHRFLENRPIKARRISAAERFRRWCRRNPVVAALTLTVFALLGCFAVGATVAAFWLEEERDAARTAEGRTRQALALAEERLRESRVQSATSTLERAMQLCEQGDVNHGLLWLTRGLETVRLAEAVDLEQAFRWNLGAWSQEVHRLERILPHPDAVEAVAFTPDATRIVTGCKDGKVRLWQAATGQPEGEPLVHPGPVHALAVHPKGELILTGCADGIARLWQLPSGKPSGAPLVHYQVTGPVEAWPWQTGILSVAFSRDGETFATAGRDGKAQLWDTATRQSVGEPLVPGGGSVFAVAFRPDGQAVLTGGHNWNLQQWDSKTGKALGPTRRHLVLFSASYSPDGKRAVAGYLQDRTARQWDLTTGRMIEPALHHQNAVKTACYSPDGKWILTGSEDQTARLWDAATGRPIGSPLEHTGYVVAATFSPDGRTVVTGCIDGMARLWKVAPGSRLRTVTLGTWVRALAFSPDGSRLLTGTTDQLCQMWDPVRGNQIGGTLRHGGWVQGLAFSPDGKTVFGLSSQGASQLYRWDLDKEQLLSETGGHDGEPWRLAVDPTGTLLITGGRYQPVARIWDAKTGQILPPLLQHESGDVLGVAIRPDGKAVLTGGEDKTLRLWDLPTGKPLGPPLRHSAGIVAVAFSPDGNRVLTGSQDRALQQWDAETWKPIGAPLRHQGTVNSVAYVSGTPLLASGSDDNSARFWFAPTGHPVGPALTHGDRVTTLAVSTALGLLASASDDSTAKLWRVPRPATEDPAHLAGWIEAITGLALDRNGSIRVLSAADWRDRQEHFLPLPSLPVGEEAVGIEPNQEKAPNGLAAADRRLYAVLQGNKNPDDAAELMRLARYATHEKRLFAATAALFKNSFQAHPDWADARVPAQPNGLKFTNRRFAAAAAAMAAGGAGDGAKLAGEQRAAWGRQARDWLHAELEAWQKGLDGATPNVAAEIVRFLDDAHDDAWLASVRDAGRSDGLPAAERDAYRRLWAASARLFAAAFAIDAKLTEVTKGRRYNAACDAALASCGPGVDTDRLDDKERASLRKQAVAWLRADLAYWTQVIATANPADRAQVDKTLKHWKHDTDLAGLRDPDAGAQLPADEREACAQLWAAVDALLEKMRD